jgi:hypothetical protein
MAKNIKQKIALINEKYPKKIKVVLTEEENGIVIESLVPIKSGPTKGLYLYYSIWPEPDEDPKDWSRRMFQRHKDGQGVHGFEYGKGLGIWSVTQDGRPFDLGKMTTEQFDLLRNYMWDTEKEYFRDYPEIEKVLEEIKNSLKKAAR